MFEIGIYRMKKKTIQKFSSSYSSPSMKFQFERGTAWSTILRNLQLKRGNLL